MPNFIAYGAICVWPLIIIFLIKRYGNEKGILLSLLIGYMFLPAGFSIDLPAIPPLNKFSITTLTITAFLLVSGKSIGYKSLSPKMKMLVAAFVVSPFLTVLNNSERVGFLPGLSLYDGLSDTVNNLLYFIPFLIGARYFKSYQQQLMIFRVIAVAAFVYAFFALFEIRMSPQLHIQLYGYFPHSWLQQYREGGFRAIVFMGHGLLVAFFFTVGFACLSTLAKQRIRILPFNNYAILFFLLITLILMKSMAALIFALFACVMILFTSRKLIHLATIAIAALFVTYPTTSSLNIFPHQQILNIAGSISANRQQSLEYRFDNETILLDHALKKPLFGWGGWGRNRVYDPETGEDISTTDGNWIVKLGIKGWFGFLAEFLFFIIPLWLAFKLRTHGNIPKKEGVLLSAHALIVAIILLDQMPNASMNALYWLIVGALLGRIFNIQESIKTGSYDHAENDMKDLKNSTG